MRPPLAEALGASATFLLTTNDCGETLMMKSNVE